MRQGEIAMIDSVGRGVLVGALALVVVGLPPASAQTPLKLSDTITLRNGTCTLVSDAADDEKPPETHGPQKCVFQDSAAGGLTRVYVPGNKDEIITFEYAVTPGGAINGKGREGVNQLAYACTITGQTKPGVKHGGLLKAGAIIRVLESTLAL
jgi:hypothetical protein